MVKRFTMLFLVLAIATGVVSGTPLHSPNDKMMKCCDKAKSKDGSPAANAADLCCAVNCSESVPTPSNASFNFSPSNAQISKSIAEQIAALFPYAKAESSVSPKYLRETLTRTFQPKYLQHNSFRI